MLGYNIPADTQEVWFWDNSITYVEAEYYKNLPYLDVILLDHNAILDIEDFAFVHVPSVTVIKLHENKLSVICKNIFAGLSNLTTLFLAHNEIHEIQLESFKDNSALEDLRLHHNFLQVCYRINFCDTFVALILQYFGMEGFFSCRPVFKLSKLDHYYGTCIFKELQLNILKQVFIGHLIITTGFVCMHV